VHEQLRFLSVNPTNEPIGSVTAIGEPFVFSPRPTGQMLVEASQDREQRRPVAVSVVIDPALKLGIHPGCELV
jgi:hypothetical protein